MTTKQATTADLFDRSPITIGGFKLSGHTATPVGAATLEGWTEAFLFATSVDRASPFWVVDLLRFAQGRLSWQDEIDQVIGMTGLTEKRLLDLQTLARQMRPEECAVAQSLEHARIVCSVKDPQEQREWLEKSKTEGWRVVDLRRELRSAKRRGILTGQADLIGRYHVVYADPPWIYGNSQPSTSSAQSHYPGMTIDQLCKLPIAAHTMKDAVLFMWVTAPMLYENPGPREVIDAWGFSPKTQLIWDKVAHNFGSYVSVRHELLMVASRGSCTPDHPTPMPDSVVTERRTGVHSEKPDIFRRIIEKLYDGPYVELFARRPAKGWTTWGNQLLEEVGTKKRATA